MKLFKVVVERVEYQRGEVLVEAENEEEAKLEVEENGADTDVFETVNAEESVQSVAPAAEK